MNLKTPKFGGDYTRATRGEKIVKVVGRPQLEPLVDWWIANTGGAVKAVAFPVRPE